MVSANVAHEYETFRQLILEQLIKSGWKKLLAKRIRYEQSLFEHSLNALDVLLTYLPIFRRTWHPPLLREEEVALIVTAVAHDAGKATEEFQRYIRGEPEWVGHWAPDLTQALVRELYELWSSCDPSGERSLETRVREVMAAVQYTIRQERTQGLEAREGLRTDHLSQRWRLFMDVVDATDNLVSCATVVDAVRFFSGRPNPLSRIVSAAYHQAYVRGVSTVLLHQAAQEAFASRQWQPLLFYPEGTLYISGDDDPRLPSPDDVKGELREVCRRELEARAQTTQELVVGNITQNFLPKPELFDAARLSDYLRVSAKRAKAKPAEKVDPWNVIKVLNELHPELTRQIRRDGRLPPKPGRDEATRLEASLPPAARQEVRDALGSSQPEMAIFTFFKNVVDRFFRASSSPDRLDAYAEVKQRYESIFGPSTFDAVMRLANLKPAEDYLLAIRAFHRLPGVMAGQPDVESVALLRPEERQRVLIDFLVGIAESGFALLGETPSFSQLAQSAADVAVRDLLVPSGLDPQDLAEGQLRAYVTAKERRAQAGICPTCNASVASGAEQGITALKDFYGGSPDAFSNRRVAHGPRFADTICSGCYYERLLQQILLAGRPAEVIAIFPQMNVAPYGAATLKDRVHELEEEARRLTSPDTARADRRFDLTASWSIAHAVGTLPQGTLGSDPRLLASAFSYRTREETQRTYRRNLVKGLEAPEEFDSDLVDLNAFYGTAFSSFAEAAEAILERTPQMWTGLAGDLTGRLYGQAFRLARDYTFVLQTANLILLPIGHRFGTADSSETKAGLARLLAALFLALVLDASVAVVPFSELADAIAERGLGVAYVPPLAELRQLLGGAWVSIAENERWLRAIAGAFRLARLAKYPERSDAFQVLSEPSVGRTIRRIEEVGNGKLLGVSTLPHLEALKEVLG